MRFDSELNLRPELWINGQPVGYVDRITMRGLETVASHLGYPPSFDDAWMPFIALGSGLVGPSTEDLAMETELHRKRGTVTVGVTGVTYEVRAVFGLNEPAGVCIVREVGLLNDIVGGVLGVRWIIDEDINKNADDIVDVTCLIYLE